MKITSKLSELIESKLEKKKKLENIINESEEEDDMK